MTSSARIEANRRNCQRSTGPKTEDGKNRSRLNAVKHGMTSQTDVLPGEDREEFLDRMVDWTKDLNPRTSVERYLSERAARVSWQLDRAERAHTARLAA